MNFGPHTGSDNDLKFIWLKEAKKHLEVAVESIEYAMSGGQANVQVDGFVDADKAIATAKKRIAEADDLIKRATEAS